MKIDKDVCTGCEACHPYCTVGAIKTAEWEGEEKSDVDQVLCVECGLCLRAEICPVDAIYRPELPWPRILREHFSNPLTQHPVTALPGRGTEEIKTNDVTGRLKPGFAGMAVEMGRPGVGSTFRDLEKVSKALGKLGVRFEPENPITTIMVDEKTGKLKDEILDERFLSGIIEFSVEMDRIKDVLATLREVSTRIDTVFTLDLACRVGEDGSVPTVKVAEECGFTPRPNTKTNVGLGRN
ncbi:MAG: 4Fe-4S dicluster domain-containing protein [Desulfobacterales bacterium]|nr:4Fe-4S dicluster domain-containing protein [Desulfobacterales bacterium]